MSKDQRNQRGNVQKNKEQVSQTKLIEDRWDDVHGKHKYREIETELRSFLQQPCTDPHQEGIPEHDNRIENI